MKPLSKIRVTGIVKSSKFALQKRVRKILNLVFSVNPLRLPVDSAQPAHFLNELRAVPQWLTTETNWAFRPMSRGPHSVHSLPQFVR